jgi:hypothetical protein
MDKSWEEKNEIEAEKSGFYDVVSLNQYQYDTSGNIIWDTIMDLGGTIELTSPEDLLDEDPFNYIVFDINMLTNCSVFQWFDMHQCIDRHGDNFSIYWDGDPLDERIMFWGIAPGETFYMNLTITYENGNEIWTRYIAGGGIDENTTTGTLYMKEEIILHKR